MTTNTRRLDRSQPVAPRGRSESFVRHGLRLSVLTAEDAGVDTKALARISLTAVNRVDWCDGCRQHTQTEKQT
jgi:hypothetical protein